MDVAIVFFLIGVVSAGVFFTYMESYDGWGVRLKIKKLRPKVGDMYATYNNFYVEHWMTEDYTELFQVEYVGKKFIRLKSIEDKRSSSGGTSKDRVVDVEILSLKNKYQKYSGTKNKKTMYDDLLDQ